MNKKELKEKVEYLKMTSRNQFFQQNLREKSSEILITIDPEQKTSPPSPSTSSSSSKTSQEENGPMKEIFQAIRGMVHEPEKNKHCYDGVYYRNSFKVHGGPIYLESVGFFGPATEKEGEYTISVIVEEPLFCSEKNRIYHRGQGTIICQQGEKMYYNFGDPVLIMEDKWYGVSFCLAGKVETARMKPGDQYDSCEVNITNFQKRKFTFIKGSCQMPVIRFSVP